ncbi:MAG: AraC family transcriptional regulator [Pseudomonadota bacterium]
MSISGSPPQAFLYLWDDRFLWVSRSFRGALTRRYATSLIVAIESKPLILKLPGEDAKPVLAAVCASGAKRGVTAVDTPFLGLNFDPGTTEAVWLESLIAPALVQEVSRASLSFCDPEMAAMLDGRLDGTQARALSDHLMQALIGQALPEVKIDPRVRYIADHLRATLPAVLQVEPLAQQVSLSPTRLMHLFSDQIGLSMSSFLLWQKMRRAVSIIQSGLPLTEIAHACGFSDSSHMTRTFQAFYAVRPSALADPNFVQVRIV